jgi:hypothetical protein
LFHSFEAERAVRHTNPHLMWSSDFEITPGDWFGEWLHAELAANAHFEQRGFMPDRDRAS